MTPRKIALITTTSAVIAGATGLAWWAQRRFAMGPGQRLAMVATEKMASLADLAPGASFKASNARSFENLSHQAPSSGKTPGRPGMGIIGASTDASQSAMVASQKLIRTGQLTLEVKVFDEAFNRIQRIASENGGYIADIKANRQDQGRASGTVVVRVQPGRYFQSLDALRAIGRVEQEGVSTQDVTKEYADLEARLTNKRQLEARMREILRTRSAKMEDLLEAEQQLSQVTEQLEQMEGQRRYFQQMVAMSTLTLELHEPLVVVQFEKPGLFAPVAVAARNSIELLVQFFALLVSALVFLAPWLLLGAGTWMAIRRMAARKKIQHEA